MRILGIETSCDETGIAIYDSEAGLLAEALYSQTDTHAKWGGVVPELASRDHIKKVIPLIDEVLAVTQLKLSDIHGIAYTKGPGLNGALLVGAMLAKTLGFALDIPTIGVHHLEGHILAPFLEPTPPVFPFVALLVSGGHTQLLQVNAFGSYSLIGDTLDDAVGEAFDKTAKLLGLGYPGGKALAELARKGKADQYRFPRPMIDRPGCDFSFSGLKTFALHTYEKSPQDDQTKADIAHAFEAAVVDTLRIKCKRALELTGFNTLVIAGGVGANLTLRNKLNELGALMGINIFFPRISFCTDNGAMIAYAGCQRLLRGAHESLAVEVLPRWSLETLTCSV